jgi:hypothetical protein
MSWGWARSAHIYLPFANGLGQFFRDDGKFKKPMPGEKYQVFEHQEASNLQALTI